QGTPKQTSTTGRPITTGPKAGGPPLFQPKTAPRKAATIPPRNRPQYVRLCQLPGSGVGQIRKGGASKVRSSKRSSVAPAIKPSAKTKLVKLKSIMARGQGNRFVLQICDRALKVLWR